MASTLWLWLNEAADKLAHRLAEVQSEKFPDEMSGVAEARRQLMEQARRGSIDIQGKWFSDVERLDGLFGGGWSSVGSEIWRSILSKPGSTTTTVKVDWDQNYLRCSFNDTHYGGYNDLRITLEEVNIILSFHDLDEKRSASETTNSTKMLKLSNGSGAPRIFRDDLLLQTIRIAADHPDGLPEDKSELKRMLQEFAAQRWENPPSDTTIHNIVSDVYRYVRTKT